MFHTDSNQSHYTFRSIYFHPHSIQIGNISYEVLHFAALQSSCMLNFDLQIHILICDQYKIDTLIQCGLLAELKEQTLKLQVRDIARKWIRLYIFTFWIYYCLFICGGHTRF